MRILLGLVAALFAGSGVAACDSAGRCVVGDRHYYIAMPAGHDGTSEVGAIVFSHGYQGTAKGVMNNRVLRRVANDLGVALIAVKSVGQDWNLPNGPRNPRSDGSAEFRYFDAVIADASKKFAIDTDRMMATGFSAGGMMTWNLLCNRSGSFAAFAPMAGTFWLKPPKSCDRPVANVLHIHGRTDRTVPLTGRVVGNTRQGDVREGLAMYAKFGGFKPVGTSRVAAHDFECELSRNKAG